MSGSAPARYFLVSLLAGSAVLHFVTPTFYKSTIPRPLREYEDEIVVISAVAELACAAAMLLPPTRRLGGWLTAGFLVAVFPANVQSALDGGIQGLPPPLDLRWVAWARLPLQLPLIAVALGVARGGRGADA